MYLFYIQTSCNYQSQLSINNSSIVSHYHTFVRSGNYVSQVREVIFAFTLPTFLVCFIFGFYHYIPIKSIGFNCFPDSYEIYPKNMLVLLLFLLFLSMFLPHSQIPAEVPVFPSVCKNYDFYNHSLPLFLKHAVGGSQIYIHMIISK